MSSATTTTDSVTPSSLDTKPITVLLYGLGAIGSFYAFILQRNSNVELSVVARSNYDAVKANGLHIKSENHGEYQFHPKAVYRYAQDADGKTFDYIVCCNKATNPMATAMDLKNAGIVDVSRTTIALMQNGVGNEDAFVEVFPGITILSGVVWIGATQDSPGVIRQHLAESTTIGIFSPNSSSPSSTATATDNDTSSESNSTSPPMSPSTFPAHQLASLSTFTTLLTHGKHPYTVSPTIQTARWQKCIWNCAWNALTTLTSRDCHAWLSSSSAAMSTTYNLMNEAVHVAQSLGIPEIDENLPKTLIDRMLALKGPVWTSMYHDMKAGRDMEVEVILGSIVRWGVERGVPVPTLQCLYALLFALGRMDGKNEALVNGERR